ncbi:MAG: heavy metal translocating P-type ATPase [Actinomycetota bacterium]|nr:heavy metal translocating P-type ATPase [Actinomycetota bacterium]
MATGGLLDATGASPVPRDRLWAAAGVVGGVYSLWTTVQSLRAGRIGVDIIALLAVVGALATDELLAAGVIGVMITSGRALEGWAAGRARRDLDALLQNAPHSAHLYQAGALTTVPVEQLVPGDRVMVAGGELVPADGNLLGDAVLDESTLSGESRPVERTAGDPIRSGAANAGAPFDVMVTVPAAESSYAGVVRLVEQAEASQAPFVRLADRYALWFLALTSAASAAAWAAGGVSRAVAVLVVATPCPLILAAPVAWVAGLSRSARRGVVTKGGAVLERLAGCTTVLIDKTGTLTTGHPTVTDVVPAGPLSADAILGMAASLDQLSPHVLAQAVLRAARQRGCRLLLPTEVEEVPGRGIRGLVAGQPVALGKAEWVGISGAPGWAKAARRRAALDGSMTVFVSVDGQPAGVLMLDDPVRPDASRTVRALRRSGIDRIVMVTGDRPEVAETVGAALGVDEVLADRSPAEKLDVVRFERHRAPTVMVGDGINDAPALALADVGVAMGARGATASSQAADMVLTVDRLDRLGEARSIARRSRRIAVQSVMAGMAMSLTAMAIAGFGWLPAVWGAVWQEGIDVAVIVNALRALRPQGTELRLDEEGTSLTRRFQAEHVVVRAAVEQIRACADLLDRVPPPRAAAEVRDLYRLLAEEVAPHESAEQDLLYPALERLLGGSDPTGPMSRAHVEIAHQIRRLGQLLGEIGPEGPDGEEIAELRRLLYGLHAVLKLHTTQEEESYLSLGDEPAPAPPGSDHRSGGVTDPLACAPPGSGSASNERAGR